MSARDLGIPGRSAPRARSGCGWRVGLLAALVALLCAVGALFLLPRQPGYTLPNVTITDPSDGAQLTTARPLSVITSASSPNKVTKQELWVDSRLVYVTPSRDPQGQERFPATLLWTPRAGPHTLVVRATDARGSVGMSGVVRVSVSESAAPPAQNFIEIAQPGDTVDSIAKENAVTSEQIRQANPGLADPPPPGEWVNVPPTQVPQGSDDQPGGAVNDPGVAPLPGDLPVGPANPNPEFPGFGPPLPLSDPGLQPPAAPDLNVVANPDCSVTLSWRDNSNNESGFYVYRLVAGAARYTRVEPSFAANHGNNVLTYTDRGIFGHLDYYVSAFNGAGETASRFVGIDLPANCMRNLIGQMLEVEAESLTISVPTEEVYCYASLKGHRPFERVPMDQNAYLKFMGPRVPRADFLIGEWNIVEYYAGANKRVVAAPEGGQPFRVEVECWGARVTNEGGVSLPLGSFDQSHPPSEWDGRALTGRGDSFTLVYHIRPWTGPGGAGNALQDPDIPAPYGLRRVRDVNDCVAHVPAEALLACALANYTDHPPLVWEWDGIPEQIDGFRIYMNRTPVGGTFVPIVDDWPKDARLWPGPSEIPCGETWRYAVAAYDLNVQSQMSEFIALSGEECDNLALVEVELLTIKPNDIDDGPLAGGTLDITTESYGRAWFWTIRGGQITDQQKGASLIGPVRMRQDKPPYRWADLPLCHNAGDDTTCLDPMGRNNNKLVLLVREREGLGGMFVVWDEDLGLIPSGDDIWCHVWFEFPAMSLDEWARFDQTAEEESGHTPYGDCIVRVRVRGLGRVGGSRVLAPGGGGPGASGRSANLQVVNFQRNRAGNARVTIRNAGPDTLIGDTATLEFQVARVPSGEGGSPGTIWEHEERVSLTIPAFGQTTIDTGQVLLQGFENRVRVVITAVNFTDPDLRINAFCRSIDVPDAQHVTIQECARGPLTEGF